MPSVTSQSELAACLASIERMIERARLLIQWTERAGPNVRSETSPYAISFPELRALDRLCKDALERVFADHPTYAENWYVNDNKGLSSAADIHSEFVKKRQIMLLAQHALEAEHAGTASQDKYGGPENTRASGARSMRILFLAANPSQTSRLDLEEELRSLEQELRSVKFRDSIVLVARHAVRPDDLLRHVRADKPNIIHFSGHGSKAGIILQTDTGGYQAVEGASLRRFLQGRGLDLIVLNACYSKDQGETISEVVNAVVGTTEAVGDEAARRFTVAFYRSLGNGLSVGEAFRDGGDAVALHGLTDVFRRMGDMDLILVS